MSKIDKDVYSVLVADDSADDKLLLKAAMRHARRLRIVGEVSDGDELISYLSGHGEKTRAEFPLPDLLLLDLKMPGKDGFEVLKWLKANEMDGLMVVVLTDSMQAEHIKRAMDLGADFFQVKPRAQHERVLMVQALEEQLAGVPAVGAQ
jgi:CheY-like chemotaxis protein